MCSGESWGLHGFGLVAKPERLFASFWARMDFSFGLRRCHTGTGTLGPKLTRFASSDEPGLEFESSMCGICVVMLLSCCCCRVAVVVLPLCCCCVVVVVLLLLCCCCCCCCCSVTYESVCMCTSPQACKLQLIEKACSPGDVGLHNSQGIYPTPILSCAGAVHPISMITTPPSVIRHGNSRNTNMTQSLPNTWTRMNQ